MSKNRLIASAQLSQLPPQAEQKESQRVGYYCWAGPGLARMTELKYFGARMDRESLWHSYDEEYLWQLKKKLGVTDMWVTYSWGFAPEREQEDYDFILSRLENFQRVGIRTNAYVQGPNVVYQDFTDRDWYAEDEMGRPIAYHRGRRVTCLNNPEFQVYLQEKVTEVVALPFDGVFIDNIQMGKLGMPKAEGWSNAFVGCNCKHCQAAFREETGESIPRRLSPKANLTDAYLRFRQESSTTFLSSLSTIAQGAGKAFGTNSYDPKFDTRYSYGVDLRAIAPLQDYLLFENHSFPQPEKGRGNHYISQLKQALKLNRPVFVVSYKKGIGFDSAYSQADVDMLFAEAATQDFHLCLKGSEFLTWGKWHNLDLDRLRAPEPLSKVELELREPRRRGFRLRVDLLFRLPFLRYLLRRYANSLYLLYFEDPYLRRAFAWLQVRLMRQ